MKAITKNQDGNKAGHGDSQGLDEWPSLQPGVDEDGLESETKAMIQ